MKYQQQNILKKLSNNQRLFYEIIEKNIKFSGNKLICWPINLIHV